MKKWDKSDPRAPTWWAVYDGKDVRQMGAGYKDNGDIRTNLRLAKKHIIWLKAQREQHRENIFGGSPWQTVAVLYDYVSDKHYASTVPRGALGTWFVLEAKSERKLAPAWWSAISRGQNMATRMTLHAEDGAYVLLEDNKVPINEGRYPQGTVIATWTYATMLETQNNGNEKDGKFIAACSDESRKTNAPPCNAIASRLGVIYAKSKDAKDNVETGDPWDLKTDEEALEHIALCPIDPDSSEKKRLAIRDEQTTEATQKESAPALIGMQNKLKVARGKKSPPQGEKTKSKGAAHGAPSTRINCSGKTYEHMKSHTELVHYTQIMTIFVTMPSGVEIVTPNRATAPTAKSTRKSDSEPAKISSKPANTEPIKTSTGKALPFITSVAKKQSHGGGRFRRTITM
ncbi:hypothetical protein QQS21_000308 [Conoideocrella luteorostrata]|uniref:Uncharacterized protein n=1 Tax=Conoideocrella luteorostrata TaxID=1105319 RepID=A0AAJ0CZ11_9HYPO|nr:hypothetical protein QQS21_000308 [Conoideocrella luteorostrata]